MYSNLSIKNRAAVLESARDRSFASALFYGTLERKRTLDEVLRPFLKGGSEKLDPEVRAVLESGVYRQLFLRTGNEAAPVSDSVEICRALKKRSACGLVNAVLRKTGSINREEIASFQSQIRLSVCDPLYEKLTAVYGAETERILEGTLIHEKDGLRVNTLRVSREKLQSLLTVEGITAETAGLPDALLVSGGYIGTEAFRRGLFHVIGIPAQTAALALGAKPGERILDLCAAPGGKTAVIAEEMHDQGEIVALDKYASRIRIVEQNAARLGISCIRAVTADASGDLSQYGEFDRVLCDVPCSGFGEMAKKPELRYKDPNISADLPALQLTLLENAASRVRKGGRVVYSTCTVFPQENEDVVSAFKQRHPEFAPAAILESTGEGERFFLPGRDGSEGF